MKGSTIPEQSETRVGAVQEGTTINARDEWVRITLSKRSILLSPGWLISCALLLFTSGVLIFD